jgi:acyl-CoA reductase-like NAD-dependent aldehyde dehydrogenase
MNWRDCGLAARNVSYFERSHHSQRDTTMLKEIVKYELKVKGAKSSEFTEVKSPYSGEVIASIAQADEQAIKQAISVAEETFHNVMRKMPAYKRSQILMKTSELLLKHQEDLARTIALEGGKPIKDARIEVARAAMTFAISAEEALRLEGEQLPDQLSRPQSRTGIGCRQHDCAQAVEPNSGFQFQAA